MRCEAEAGGECEEGSEEMRLTRGRLTIRTLQYHARAYALVMIVTAVAAAIITGALFVGDSVRGSLRARVEDRLGDIEFALTAPGYFREALAAELQASSPTTILRSVAILLVKGTVTHADTGARASEVNVLGVPRELWGFWADRFTFPAGVLDSLRERAVVINESLAEMVGAGGGTAILVHVSKDSDVPAEHALGRKAGTVRPIRLEVGGVLPDHGPGLFALESSQVPVRNVFVPLETLQRSLGREGQANSLLVSARASPQALQTLLGLTWKIEDAGLRFRVDDAIQRVVVESRALLLPAGVSTLVKMAASRRQMGASETLTYLANTIALGSREIPYSTVAACDQILDHSLQAGTIALNQWAADDLGARVGDTLRLKYFIADDDHRLREVEAAFLLSEIVPMEGDTADPGWTPEYPGISNARSLRAWDPPFPVDLDRIREKDEDYWRDHRTTPKAFLPIADGKRLWASRFGDLTSLRLRPLWKDGDPVSHRAKGLDDEIARAIKPESLGLTFRAVKADGLRAAQGGTDFGGLFVSFSFFLIASALILLSMVFRIACDRRARELGILKAVGIDRGALSRLLLVDGAIVSLTGSALGCWLALAYASLLLLGLRTIWRGAVNAPFLELHTTWGSWLLGCGITLVCALGAVGLVGRRVASSMPRSLLAGSIPEDNADGSSGARLQPPGRLSFAIAAASLLAGFALVVCGALGLIAAEAGFFGGGAAIALGALAFFRAWLRAPRGHVATRPRARSILLLGAMNARRSPSRSLLTTSLIASASFVIVAVAAIGRDPGSLEPRKSSGNGGFSLIGKSSIPITVSLSLPEGREALGLGPEASRVLERARVFPFRVRPGDDASCLNLYRPQSPRLLGAPRDFIERGGFAWASSLHLTNEERANPWILLDRRFSDGAIPAVGDASTVQWILHSGLSEDIVIRGDDGQEIRLRLVGLLSHSIFQGELVVSEARMLEAFPRISGNRWFLFEAAQDDAGVITRELESGLESHGFDVEATGALLAGYQAVENTYLSTFQLLGGLGLLLGTLGLAAILARNVHERRGELALLRAVGASRSTLARLVLGETALLLAAGLACGAGSAGLAVLPGALSRSGSVPWAALGATFTAIVTAGFLASIVAVRAALRAPLVPALRRD